MIKNSTWRVIFLLGGIDVTSQVNFLPVATNELMDTVLTRKY